MNTPHPDSDRSPPRRRLPVWVRATMGMLAGLVVIVIVARFSSNESRPTKSSAPHGKEILADARAAHREGRDEDALRLLDQISDDGSSEAVTARYLSGELLLTRFRRLTAAEQQFRRAVAQDEDNPDANNRLAWLMHLGTRSWELVPFELSMIRQGRPTLRRMKTLVKGPHLQTDVEFINEYSRGDLEDPIVLLGLAAVAIYEQDYASAERLLRIAALMDPHPAIVEYRIGEVLLLRKASDAEFAEWHRALSTLSGEHPGIWLILGLWSERQNEPDVAVRCFWEALRRDPNLRQANYRLGRLLRDLEQPDAAEPFLERSRRLTEYANMIEVLNARRTEKTAIIEDALKVAELTRSLGLLFEACGWFRLTLQLNPADPRALEGVRKLQPKLASLPRIRTIPKENPALKTDLSAYPLPDANSVQTIPAEPASSHPASEQVTFEDRAAAAGLDFTYIADAEDPGIYELTGGGVAILDYDGDGWPDVYLTQGGPWPPQADEHRPSDRLYRNLGGRRFQDATREAGLVEGQYSQGATVGDYNSDGHPDLYVANLDVNRLYRNNGDSSFTDVTDVTGTSGERWTSSCAMADLNGDRWPDIYAVNYLGETALTTICRNETGRLHDCTPYQFPAEQDQLYLNLGDGRFQNVTLEAGIEVPDGKGLGIIAADFNRTGNIDVFVANDGVPNFLFVNQASRGERPVFIEQGLPTGLAVNAKGEAEAGMGVAAGDMDGNGLIDLFVTNFSNESNTLYLQQLGHAFLDTTYSAGLNEPSLPMLGFGTQCLDGALNGTPDLIVTNGHIHQDAGPHVEFEMEPQYFLNSGEAKFVELSAQTVGRFFSQKRLGRGMARLDWNRDGLEDVVISHIGAPAALLTNTTFPCGNYISISLRGVESDRDATGTIVTLAAGDLTLVRQLIAGDGYQASNERRLVFGLGATTHVTDLQVEWPSGQRQNFRDLPANSQYLFIEGCARRILLSN